MNLFRLREIEVIWIFVRWLGVFSESVLAALPFPSMQSFSVILLLEPFQLMSKFTRYRLDIFSDTVYC